MITILRKPDQFNTTIFNGQFIVNKPVAYRTKPTVSPYGNLFYWSHAYALGDCEFGLHPHEGFEIMTFILDGQITHFDTSTQVWTPLEKGDFQVIQSNRGIAHEERVSKGSRAFQIWFDPNFNQTISLEPSYADYHANDFPVFEENGIHTITYVGGGSHAVVQTPQITIKKYQLHTHQSFTVSLDPAYIYTYYVISGTHRMANESLVENDAIRFSEESSCSIWTEQSGELFLIQTPITPAYRPVWSR